MKPPKRTDKAVEEQSEQKPNGHLPPEEEHDPDQAWVWTEAWQKKLREAEEDLREGRYKDFDSMDALLADLDNDDEE